MRTLFVLCVGNFISFTLTCAAAHDLSGIFGQDASTSENARRELEDLAFYQQVLASRQGGPQGREGVIDKAYIWKKDVLSVCFFGGADAAIEQIEDVANVWTSHTRLSFDFGSSGQRYDCATSPRADIRVSFSGSGNWSYVGTEATLIDVGAPTLNLAEMGTGRNLSNSEKGTVSHEFGHAIGLMHEHQSPVSMCEDEFNWEWLYDTLSEQGMTKDDVDHNMRQLLVSSSKSGFILTEFDRKSNMLYSLPAEAYASGRQSPCYIEKKNHVPSGSDLAVVRAAYPPLVRRSIEDPVLNSALANPEVEEIETIFTNMLDNNN